MEIKEWRIPWGRFWDLRRLIYSFVPWNSSHLFLEAALTIARYLWVWHTCSVLIELWFRVPVKEISSNSQTPFMNLFLFLFLFFLVCGRMLHIRFFFFITGCLDQLARTLHIRLLKALFGSWICKWIYMGIVKWFKDIFVRNNFSMVSPLSSYIFLYLFLPFSPFIPP